MWLWRQREIDVLEDKLRMMSPYMEEAENYSRIAKKRNR